MRGTSYFWTDEAIDRLCKLHRDGASSGAIAADLGISRNAVMGRIHRLRAAGDQRIPPAGEGAVPRRRTLVQRLAEWMSIRDMSLDRAAYELGVSRGAIATAWERIVADLGWQAS